MSSTLRHPLAAMMERGLGRSPTFLVGTETQRFNLEQLQRREQHLAEQYAKNKPLCFNASAYQMTHPQKAVGGHIDADVTLVTPMMLGVADGVSQIAEFGLDPSELPKELLVACEELAMDQLLPEQLASARTGSPYLGPVPLMREAYEQTECLGSTTVLLAILDNSSKIHGKLHPMLAVLSIGDCQIVILRQLGKEGFTTVFNTEMQRIGGNAQCPLQVCRVDERIDKDFDENMVIEVIERGSAVHCVSAYEGDIVIMGSDGVFDNLFADEIVNIANQFLLSKRTGNGNQQCPRDPLLLQEVARQIVEACHAKTRQLPNGLYPETPIGVGGKRDDTCCVVGEVVEFSKAQEEACARLRKQRQWDGVFSGFGGGLQACFEVDSDEEHDFNEMDQPGSRAPRSRSKGSRESSDDGQGCCIS